MASSSHGAVAEPHASCPHPLGQQGHLLLLPAPSPWVSGASTPHVDAVSPPRGSVARLGSARRGLGPTEPVWCWAWGGGSSEKGVGPTCDGLWARRRRP